MGATGSRSATPRTSGRSRESTASSARPTSARSSSSASSRRGLPLLRARTPSAMPRMRRGRSRPSRAELVPKFRTRRWWLNAPHPALTSGARGSRSVVGAEAQRVPGGGGGDSRGRGRKSSRWISAWSIRRSSPSRRGSGSRCPSAPRSCARGPYGRRLPHRRTITLSVDVAPAASARSGCARSSRAIPVEFKGPTGGFVFNRADPRRAVFVAEEIGIVPVRAILADLYETGYGRPTILIYWARDPSLAPLRRRVPLAGAPLSRLHVRRRRCERRPRGWRGETGEAAAAVDRLVHSVDKLVVLRVRRRRHRQRRPRRPGEEGHGPQERQVGEVLVA